MLKKHLIPALLLFRFFFHEPCLFAQLPIPINYGQSIVGTLPSTSSTVSYTTPFAQPGDVLMIRAAPSGLMHLKVELYAPSGQFLMEYLANADYIVHFFYPIPPAPVGESGVYKMIVSNTDGFFTGDFCLFLQRTNETPNVLSLHCNSSLSDDLDCISSCLSLRYMVQQGAVSRITIHSNSLSTPEAWLCSSDGTILKYGVATSGYTLTFDTISATYTGCYFVFVTDFGAFFTTGGFNVSHTLISGDCAAPVVQVAPSNGSVCAGSPFSLTASSPLPNATYAWSGPNGFTSSQPIVSFGSATPAMAGTYTVTVAAPTVCPNTFSKIITVKPLPTATASVTPPDGSVCAGESFNLNVATNAGGLTSYNWSGPKSYSSTQKSPTLYNTTPNQSGFYKIVVTDGNGCIGTDSIAVSVHALPDIVISQPASGGVCKGSTLQLFAQTDTTGASYLWTGPNAFTSILQNPQIPNVTSAAAGSYFVTVTDSYGCSDYQLKYIPVWNLPVASIVPVSASVCAGDSIKLTANGGTLYKWSSNATTKETYAKPLQTTMYSVTVTDNNGCTDTENTTITVKSLPAISVTSTPAIAEICSGSGQILLSVMSSDASNPVWKWTKNGGFFSANQFLSLSNPGQSGIFTAFVTDGITGCSNTALPVTVNIYQTPTVSVTQITQPPYFEGDDFTICANSNASIPDYEWTGPNGFTDISACVMVNNASLLNSGIYNVTVTDGNGCKGFANVDIEIMTVGTVQPAIEWGLSISPNPSFGLFEVVLKKSHINPLQFSVFDESGRLLRSFALETDTKTLDLTDLPSGIYLLRIAEGRNTGFMRLAILK